MELPIPLVYGCIVILSVVILSPKIHTGLVCTIGLSMIAIGFLGIALQDHELGSTQFGVSGQWQAIKYGLVVSVIGLIVNLIRKRQKQVSNPRELESHELHQVRGRGE